MTTITDRKLLTGASYSPVVQTATDYYAFGAPIAERSFNASGYRYGFNTQEKTDEIAGAGNHTTALFWEYDTRSGRRWNLDPKPQVSISDYAVNGNNPILNNDPTGAKPDIYTAKKDGSIEYQKTNDKFDKFFVENKKGGNEFVGQFNKNENGLVQLPSKFSFTGSDGSSLGWTSHTDDSRRNISGKSTAALIGALYQTGTTDLSVGQFSLANGSSAFPSVSHKFGKNGDLRPLRNDGENKPTTVFDKGFDVTRNSNLTTALHKFGWEDIISEKSSAGFLAPFTSSAKDRGIKTDHTNHFHLQGFRPNVIYK